MQNYNLCETMMQISQKNDLCFDCLESRHSKKNCKNTVILDFIIASGVTTRLYVIKDKIEIVTTREFREIKIN